MTEQTPVGWTGREPCCPQDLAFARTPSLSCFKCLSIVTTFRKLSLYSLMTGRASTCRQSLPLTSQQRSNPEIHHTTGHVRWSYLCIQATPQLPKVKLWVIGAMIVNNGDVARMQLGSEGEHLVGRPQSTAILAVLR